MATSKVIGKLLKFKGFKAVDLAFKRDNELHIVVKPFKNGCQCLQCGRRGKIVRTRPEMRWWRDIPVGGWTVWSCTSLERSNVQPMDVLRNDCPGPTRMLA